MKKLFAALIFVVALQMPASGDVIYTFSSGSGTSAIGFTAVLPNFLNLAVGEFHFIQGNALASCTIGLPPGPNFCYSVTMARTAGGGDVSMLAASIFEPDMPVPVAPVAIFPALTFGQSGTSLGPSKD